MRVRAGQVQSGRLRRLSWVGLSVRDLPLWHCCALSNGRDRSSYGRVPRNERLIGRCPSLVGGMDTLVRKYSILCNGTQKLQRRKRSGGGESGKVRGMRQGQFWAPRQRLARCPNSGAFFRRPANAGRCTSSAMLTTAPLGAGASRAGVAPLRHPRTSLRLPVLGAWGATHSARNAPLAMHCCSIGCAG